MKKLNVVSATVFSGILFAGIQSCAPPPAQFVMAEDLSSSLVSYDHATSFKVEYVSNSYVDILFVIDNSRSMAEEQAKIAQVFSGFISKLTHMNWRIAITTTDTTTDADCSKGKLCVMRSSPSPIYFIDANTPQVNDIFVNKIKVGLNGSGNEYGLTAIKQFLTNKNSDYQSFMRANATFVTIVVTDSEETSSLTADQFLQNAKSLLPQGKKYVNHSSIVLPGDSACKLLNENEDKFSQKYRDVTVATGGALASICDQNYASQFQVIADTTIGKVAQQSLACAPADNDGDNELDVMVTNAQGQILNPSSYKISGNKIIFTPALENVGHYKIDFSCAR